ncbi:hypothetical protein SEPCBS57363_003145 [Sporothrix epigloea]|uniref:Alternative oxidase n=1 Tax=Sporothrix epigloea TaxID=1892477 RepID=A0ABP0DK19_9PEZI
MSSGTNIFSTLLQQIHHATAHVDRLIASYSYAPLNSEPSSPTGTATRRRPQTLLQSRLGKLILAGAVVVFVFLIGSVTNVPSSISHYASGQSESPVATPSQATISNTPDDAASLPPPADERLTLESARAMITKEEYIDAVMRNPVEGTLDLAPIRAKCDSVKFQPGLIWHCELVNGGIGNVGNMWLNCVRYAMEAGASYIILPRTGARSDSDLVNLGDASHSVELDSLYDVEYFLENWKQACPQLRAVRLEKEIPAIPPISQAPAIKANRVTALPRNKELMLDATGWRKGFDTWMTDNVPAYQNMSLKEPVRVIQRVALSHWNREAHAPDFACAFPRLFRFPDKMRRLAASVLWKMEKQTGKAVVSDAVLFSDLVMATDQSKQIDESASVVTSLGPGRLPPQGYLGAHLRVAQDAANAKWPGYEAQAPAYLDEAVASKLSVVYLATGSAQHRKMFKADAAKRKIDVFTKEGLLDKDELAELQSMTWDQQAIVDFEVLVHSSRFAGFVRSSFSWVVAIRRSILPEAGTPVIMGRGMGDGSSDDSSVVAVRREGHARRQERAMAASASSAPAASGVPPKQEPAFAIATAPPVPADAAAVPPDPAAKQPTPLSPEPATTAPEPVVEKYRDGLSVVVGRFDGMTINAIWP